jgi:single-strand DNA-binding protein
MNHCSIIGRLTKDLDVRYANSGSAFLSFNVAVNRQFKKEGEERQADFISCKAFGKTAEFMQKYFSKGSQIGIEGRIQTGSYEKEGARVYTTDIIVEKVHFAGGNAGGKGDSYEPANNSQQPGFFPVTSSDEELPF